MVNQSILLTAICAYRPNDTQNRDQFTCRKNKYSETFCADSYRHDWALRNSLAGNQGTDADCHKLPGVSAQFRAFTMVDAWHGSLWEGAIGNVWVEHVWVGIHVAVKTINGGEICK